MRRGKWWVSGSVGGGGLLEATRVNERKGQGWRGRGGLLAAPGAFRRPVMVVGHLLGLAWLWKSHRALDTSDMGEAAIKGYYGQIWNLFYYEYMMYPFI